MNKKIKIYLVTFLVGAVLLSIGDYFHNIKQVLLYSHKNLSFPHLGPLPFWVPIQFGLACVFGVFLAPFVKIAKKNTSPKALGVLAILFSLIFVMTPYLFSSFYSSNMIIKTAVIFMMGLLPWLVIDGTNEGIVFSLVCAVIGVSYEAFLSLSLGYFAYMPGNDQFFGTPPWLAGIYLSAGSTLRNIYYTYID